MRLFVAVDVGPAVRREAARVVDELRRRVERSAPQARVTWVQPDRLHLTIRFIGEVSGEVSNAVRGALLSPFSTGTFDVTIAGTGAFPPRRPRVLWAGISVGVEGLRSLEREVGTRLAPLGLPQEDRGFQPHLTLARVKYAGGIRAAALFDGLDDTLFGTVSVGAVTLFESRLSSTGPTYVALGRTPLAQP